MHDKQLVEQLRHCLEGTLKECKLIKERLSKEGNDPSYTFPTNLRSADLKIELNEPMRCSTPS